MSSDNDDEPVGYGRPPKRHRFKPGQSGNPKGRPKGRRNTSTEFDEFLNQKHDVLVNGKRSKRTPISVALISTLKQAAAGNIKACELVLRIAADHEQRREIKEASKALSKGQKEVIRDLVDQLRMTSGVPEIEDEDRDATCKEDEDK